MMSQALKTFFFFYNSFGDLLVRILNLAFFTTMSHEGINGEIFILRPEWGTKRFTKLGKVLQDIECCQLKEGKDDRLRVKIQPQ